MKKIILAISIVFWGVTIGSSQIQDTKFNPELSQKINELETKNKNILERLQKSERKYRSIEKELTQKTNTIRDNKKKITELKADNKNLTDKFQESEIKYTILEKDLSKKTDLILEIEHQINQLNTQNKKIEIELQESEKKYAIIENKFEQSRQFHSEMSSLIGENSSKINTTANELNAKISNAEKFFAHQAETTANDINLKTIWLALSILFILLLLVVSYLFFIRKINNSNDSIAIIKNSQRTLHEESLKLDSKLIDILETKIKIQTTEQTNPGIEVDHSLALKVADEVIRIETNLSRMDITIKGYKQLAASVRRIKDNLMANGYELVNILNKPYNDGMKVIANFIPDENLKEGEQVITSIIKPQINFRGTMIQSAQITVSQNI